MLLFMWKAWYNPPVEGARHSLLRPDRFIG